MFLHLPNILAAFWFFPVYEIRCARSKCYTWFCVRILIFIVFVFTVSGIHKTIDMNFGYRGSHPDTAVFTVFTDTVVNPYLKRKRSFQKNTKIRSYFHDLLYTTRQSSVVTKTKCHTVVFQAWPSLFHFLYLDFFYFVISFNFFIYILYLYFHLIFLLTLEIMSIFNQVK